jgi:hypothetical protein
MRILLAALFLSLAMPGISGLYAEEAALEQQKVTVTKNGVLSEKPGDAGEGVVAVLTVRPPPRVRAKNEKNEKNEADESGDQAEGEKINLIALGDLAVRLADLAQRASSVDVSGVLDGASMKVTQVIETAESTTLPKKKKAK